MEKTVLSDPFIGFRCMKIIKARNLKKEFEIGDFTGGFCNTKSCLIFYSTLCYAHHDESFPLLWCGDSWLGCLDVRK